MRRRLTLLPLVVLLAAAPAAGSGPIAFDDITAAAGLIEPMKGAYLHAAAWGDVENDGDADLFVATFADAPVSYYQQRGATGPMLDRLFLNDGAGRFTVADEPALAIAGRGSGAVFADLDADGDDDLVLSNNSFPTAPSAAGRERNHLFRNDGGHFVDVTVGSGIQPAGMDLSRAVGVLDHDGDGCLDLFVVVDGFKANAGSSRLLRGDCALHFADVTVAAGLDRAQGEIVQGLGVAIGDVDLDGRPDIFVAGGPLRRERRNFLFRNRGDGTFDEVSGGTMFAEEPAIPGGREDWTSGASFGDLDRDGDLDLAVSHHFASGTAGVPIRPRVYLNRSSGAAVSFVDVTDATGIAGIASKTPHVEIADVDNDGWPDLYLSVLLGAARQPAVYRHTGTFTAGGAPIFESPGDRSSPHYAPGGPLADVDGDGRLEPFFEEFDPAFAPPLLRNRTAGGHFLDVAVRAGTNTDGIGAVVRVYDTRGRRRVLIGTGVAQAGNGFSSASVPVVHLGLGALKKVDVEVTPPGGGPVVVERNAKAGRRLVVDVGGG